MDDITARATAPIAIAVDQLLKFGYAPKAHKNSWLQKPPLVSVGEATVLVDYYVERGTIDAYVHEQAPLLWRNKTAGVRGRCKMFIPYNERDAREARNYIWDFETENRSVRYYIPNMTTNELFALIEKGDPQPVVEPMNIPINPRQGEFHLNQLLSPESLQKWANFLVWLLERRQRQASPR